MTNVTFKLSYSITIKGQACHTHQAVHFICQLLLCQEVITT